MICLGDYSAVFRTSESKVPMVQHHECTCKWYLIPTSEGQRLEAYRVWTGILAASAYDEILLVRRPMVFDVTLHPNCREEWMFVIQKVRS